MAYEDTSQRVDGLQEQPHGEAPEYPHAEIEALRSGMHAQIKRFVADPTLTEDEWYELRHAIEAAGRQVGQRLDALTTAQRQEYVVRFCNATGFPNTFTTSQNILAHTQDAVRTVAATLGLTLAAVLYAPGCSLEQGAAIPGSDADFLCIATRDRDARVDAFYELLPNALDARLTNVRQGFLVISLAELQELADHITVRGQADEEYWCNTRGWSEGKLQRAQLAIAHLGTTGELLNNLWPDERERLDHAATGLRPLQASLRHTRHRPEKHSARVRLTQMFLNLPVDEQFGIVRILQISNEAIGLDISSSGPHQQTMQSLVMKGLLTIERGSLKAPWAPYPWLFRSMSFFFYPSEYTEPTT